MPYFHRTSSGDLVKGNPVRKYAAEQGVAEEAALDRGMAEKSAESPSIGSLFALKDIAVYKKSPPPAQPVSIGN